MSGSAYDAYRLAAHVRDHLRAYSGATIVDAVTAFEGRTDTISCVGMEIGGSGFAGISSNAGIDLLPGGVQAIILGSGRDEFLAWARSDERLDPSNLPTPQYLANLGARFMGQAVATQAIHGTGLEDGWGGSFEILLQTAPDRLQKVNRCFAVSYEVTVKDNGRLRTRQVGPQLFWMYDEEILYVCSTFPSTLEKFC